MPRSTACLDWERRIVAGESLIPFSPLYQDEAESALEVFKGLRIVDVPGRPTFGECCEPYVFDFVAAIFGAYDHSRLKRDISEFFLLISKKNMKSTLSAGIMLTALIRNWRFDQELLVVAPSIEIANNTFGPAASMVRADDELAKVVKVIDHRRTIQHLSNGAELKIVAADTDVLAGKKAGFVLIEELWKFGQRANSHAMIAEATGGLISRPEGFVINISTHSDEPPAGVFKEKLAYARDVRDGKIHDPSFLPVLYEWPEAMIEAEAYLKPENFYVTNPNIGRSVDGEWLKARLEQAMLGEGEGKQIFLAKHLNVEIGLRLRRDRWRGADLWDGAIEPALTLESLLARSEVVTVGVDAGGSDDLYGLGVCGREKGSKRWLYWAHAWCHPEVLERHKQSAPVLRNFAADGDLTICDFATQDIEEIATQIEVIAASGLLPEKSGIGLDPYAIGPLVDALAEVGIVAPQVDGVRQGWQLSSAVWTLERKLKDRTARHGGSALMAWCVSNAKAEQRESSVYITKNGQGNKIDPLVAIFNATKLMELNPVAAQIKASPYREGGFRII